MPHFWMQTSARAGVKGDADGDVWELFPLDGEVAVPLPPNGADALLLRSRGDEGECWLLLAVTPGAVALNGVPLRSGIKVLVDQDEIRFPDAQRMFFSTERLATVQLCTSDDPNLRCPRCKLVIPLHSETVLCPTCGVLCHQSERLPCWTYESTCPCCQRPSHLNRTYSWTPAEL
jgi:hypothetical protein